MRKVVGILERRLPYKEGARLTRERHLVQELLLREPAELELLLGVRRESRVLVQLLLPY